MKKTMDRRNFFRSALSKSGKTVVKAVDSRIKKQASRWIRPPFAINELEFLLSCSRCDACIDACPHHIIFSLPARTGAKFAATPALDLLNHGCHLCEDWPCVTACETGALALPQRTAEAEQSPTDNLLPATMDNNHYPADTLVTENGQLPKLARIKINEQTCLPYNGPECGACFNSCPITGALTQDRYRPVINPDLCCGCGLCRESCIVDPKAITVSSVQVP